MHETIQILILILFLFLKKIILGLGINSKKFDFFITRSQLRFIRSNHPRRLIYILKTKSLLAPIGNFISSRQDLTDAQIDEKFINASCYFNHLKNAHFVFIGDSHVEFLGRCRASKNDFSYNHTTSIWLGPKTLLGYLNQPDMHEKVKEVRKLLEQPLRSAQKHGKPVKIFWCMGTIDIRFSIYELMLRGAVSSEDGAIDLIEKAVEFIIGTHLKEIVAGFGDKCTSFGYVCCTNTLENGEHPSTIKELNNLKRNVAFPTFGSTMQRDRWMTEINIRIQNICRKYDVSFLEHPMSNLQKNRLDISLDGVHLTEPVEITRSLEKVLEK